MKLKLVVANTIKAGTDASIRTIKQNGTLLSENHVIFVPDRFSLSMEREIFTSLNIFGAFNIDVVNFNRYASKILPRKKRTLSATASTLLMRKVLEENIKNLSHYNKVLKNPEFTKSILDTVMSFRYSGYTNEDFEKTLPKLKGALFAKLKDISLISEKYLQKLTGFEDSVQKIDELIISIKDIPVIKNTHFYIVCENYFNSQQYKLISNLIKYGKSVTISLCPTNHAKNSYLFPIETFEKLKNIAYELNCPTETLDVFAVLNSPFKEIYLNLYAYSGCNFEKNENLTLIKENNPYTEIRGIAKQINFLIQEKGYRYKDIAIVCPTADYYPVIKEVFDRHDFKFFTDVTSKLSDTILIKFLFSIYEVVTSSFSFDKVIKLAKSPLSKLSDSDKFENYCLKYNINYNGFKNEFKYGKDEIKEVVEIDRNKLIDLCLNLTNECKNVNDFVKRLVKYLEHNQIEMWLNEMLSKTLLDFDNVAYEINKRAIDVLNELLTEISEFLGDTECNASEFLHLLIGQISSKTMSSIPLYDDNIFIGNVTESRYSQQKAIFVIGASFSAYPKEYSHSAILSMFDSAVLNALDVTLFPSPELQMKEEIFLLLNILSQASENLYVSYPINGFDGKQKLPSKLFSDLTKLFNTYPVSLFKKYDYFTSDLPERLTLCTKDNATFEYMEKANSFPINAGKLNTLKLALQIKDEVEKTYDRGLIDGKEYFKKIDDFLFSSVSQLQKYFRCPYLHHLTYGLKIKEREEGKLKVIDVGNLIHKILEGFFNLAMGKFDSLSEDEFESFFDLATKKALLDEKINLISETSSGKIGISSAIRTAKKTIHVLLENIQNSDFKPYSVETSFGRNSNLPSVKIPFKLGEIQLSGKIDRIDMDNLSNVLIIDYKTGSVDFDEKDIYYGINLQTYAYALSCENHGLTPKGMYYIVIAGGYTKDGQKIVMDGITIGDIYDVASIDKNFKLQSIIENGKVIAGNTAESNVLNLKANVRKKDATLKTTPQYALIEPTLHNFYKDYFYAITTGALNEIADGYIKKSPIAEVNCAKCNFLNICGGADDSDVRQILKKGIFNGLSNELAEAENELD